MFIAEMFDKNKMFIAEMFDKKLTKCSTIYN